MNTHYPRIWQTATVVLLVGGLLLLAISGYLNPLIRSALDPVVGVQGWISSRYMAVYEFLTVPRDVASLRERNTVLEAENASLQKQVIELQQQLREAQVLYSLLRFAQEHPGDSYVAARVLGADTSPFVHFVYIDKGSDDGLRHGMPVVTEQGLVGRVDAVTSSAARVQLITDPSSVVNVRLEQTDADGQMSGSLTGDVTIGMIAQDVPIQSGELILTSGLGGSYPANVLIGQVSSIRRFETDLFQSVSVQPAVDFRNLEAVLIISSFRPVDISPLVPSENP